MLDTFTWCPEVGAEATYTQRNLRVQFGDGYEQVMGDGINIEKDSWPLTFNVDKDVGELIRDFIRRHKERTPFYWTPPFAEEPEKYIGKGLSVTYPGGRAMIIKVTFEKTYRLIG